MKSWLGLVCMLGVGTSALAQRPPAAPATVLESAGKWSVDYGRWSCTLLRPMTAAGKPASMSIELEPVTKTYWLRWAIEQSPGRRTGGEDTVLLRDGQAVPGTAHYNAFPVKKVRVREAMLDLDRHGLGGVKERIGLQLGKEGTFELRLTAFPEGWRALRTCMDDLHAGLGVKPADLAAVVKEPEGKIYDFIGTLETGDFALFYWVTAEGKVEGCRLVKPSGHKKYDAGVCASLQAKGRFTPARDAAGNAVRAPRYSRLQIFTTLEVVG